MENFFDQMHCFKEIFTIYDLNLYCDEIEVCNPIGTARTAHKLTCIYFTVANIEQKYQSNLRNIHLLAVIPSLLLKGHGYAKVLDRLEQDLITLENDGIVFDFDGTTFHFKGGIATVIADNLGSHDFEVLDDVSVLVEYADTACVCMKKSLLSFIRLNSHLVCPAPQSSCSIPSRKL